MMESPIHANTFYCSLLLLHCHSKAPCIDMNRYESEKKNDFFCVLFIIILTGGNIRPKAKHEIDKNQIDLDNNDSHSL